MTLNSSQLFSALLFSPSASGSDLLLNELCGRARVGFARVRRVTVNIKSALHLGSGCSTAARPRSSFDASDIDGRQRLLAADRVHRLFAANSNEVVSLHDGRRSRIRCRNWTTTPNQIPGGDRGVKSLQLFDLDRLSSLSVCGREIGKEKVARLIVGLQWKHSMLPSRA